MNSKILIYNKRKNKMMKYNKAIKVYHRYHKQRQAQKIMKLNRPNNFKLIPSL